MEWTQQWHSRREGRLPAPEVPGVAVALELAGAGGLGLAGPGAVAAVRSLILHAQSESGLGLAARVLITRPDLVELLGGQDVVDGTAVTVVPTVDVLLDELAADRMGDCFVVCQSSLTVERRLRLVLRRNNAAKAVVLGRWKSGDVVVVDGDGRVEGASTRRAWRLVGSRLFRSPAEDLSGVRIALGCRPEKPLALGVVGRFELVVKVGGVPRDIADMLTLRQQELLVFLAVAGEDGARREVLNKAVWPETSLSRPYNSLHNALSLLRRAVERATDGAVRDLVVRAEGRYRIDRDVVDVDYWRLWLKSCSEAVGLYRDDLGDGITSLWLDVPRQELRRRIAGEAGDIVRGGASESLSAAVTLLEKIRSIDLYNEQIYHDLILGQIKLGRTDAARSVFYSLVVALREIGQHPDRGICDLVDSVE
jgi:DNA-binding SARP family transcriptional activator